MLTKISRNNKKKILNDPLYGFISIPNELIFDVIEHPYVQRLRRIMQLGLSHLVYPGAIHTRFNHVIGAMNLMQKAIHVLRRKGTEISLEEENAALLAILLHDIGHGPFSHALEYDIVSGVSHEKISEFFIRRLILEYGQPMQLALDIFQNTYERKFFHQLVSSQLDMDRLDYLNRDSFYSGVSEGKIGTNRLIEMLHVQNDQLVIEEKGIYSIEKFIVARRIMYWQVYLHKTVVSAEHMLINTLRRVKEVALSGNHVFATPSLSYFLNNNINMESFENDNQVLEHFANIDDYDILASMKVWQKHEDKILSTLSKALVNRNLFKIEISKNPFPKSRIETEKELIMRKYNLTDSEVKYFIYNDVLVNKAYNQTDQRIDILMKSGEVSELAIESDNLSISALIKPVEKYFLALPQTT